MTDVGFPKDFPTIETERLILREITNADRQEVYHNFSDREVAQWFFEEPYTRIEQADEIIQAFIDEFARGEGLTWGIARKESGQRLIGTCGYGEVSLGERGEIGFDLAKEQWGQGLMSEALKAVVEYGFRALDLRRIEAHTYSNNTRATRLLERLGFQLEEVRDDSHYYSLSREGC
jgi:ribosomal-protein-alanine N-acetyltransferase